MNKAPHKAIVNIKVEVYETLPNGQCSGRPSKRDSRLLVFEGKDLEEAAAKAEHFMETLPCQEEKPLAEHA